MRSEMMRRYTLADRDDCALRIGWPQQQEKLASLAEPVSMLEVLGVDGPDLSELPVVEPKRPDMVERCLPPEVPKTPSPVAP